jgi:tape measure domain-containing protein
MTVTYILDLQDKLTAKLKIIGIANDEQLAKWSEVQKKVLSAQGTMSNMGRSIGSLSERVKALKAQKEWIPASNKEAIRSTNHEIQKLEKEIRKLDNLDGGRFKKWFGDIKNSIPALVNPLSVAVAGIGSVIKNGMSSELQKVNMETLFRGDAQAADEMFKKLQSYAIESPYDTSGLTETQNMLMSYGMSGDKAFDTIKRLGDVSLGSADKMQRIALQMGQVNSLGKLTTADMKVMATAGFNPLQVISEKTGKSLTKLYDQLGKGKISAEQVAQALEWATEAGGQFYQGAERGNQTLKGKLNSLMESLQVMAVDFYDNVLLPVLGPVMDILGKVLGGVGKIVKGIGEAFTWLRTKIQELNPVVIGVGIVIGGITAAILIYKTATAAAAFISGIFTKAKWGEIKAWWACNAAILANPAVWIIFAVIALIAVIAYLSVKVKGWGTLWGAVVTFCSESFFAFTSGAKHVFDTLVNGIMIGIDKIMLGWYQFKEAAGLGDSAENQSAIAKINADVEARQKAIVDGAKKVAEHADKARHAFDNTNLTWDKEVKLSDVTGKLKARLGLDANATLMDNVNGGKGNTDKSTTSNTNESIVTGGTKSTTINIKFNNMVESFNFSGGIDGNESEIVNRLKGIMARVLGMAEMAV